MISLLDVDQGKPVYDEKTGKLLGWSLTMLVEDFGVFSPVVHSRFFRESWCKNSYKRMSRFRQRLLSQIKENTKQKGL
ncbi:MAG: hypothetical protein IJQ90_01035 [Alphaproteobacteria bacterium]|nr:hypothetical protein [Alphaproteobacteria bacterium]